MKEALYYETGKNNEVRCLLCPHKCQLSIGKVGLCGVRQNIEGHLISLNYGLISSIAIDPIEKKPLYQWKPGSQILSIGSVGCNLSCLFCQNHEISLEFDHVKTIENTPYEIIMKTMDYKMSSIAYTYNEPTVFYEMVLECAKLAKKNKIDNVLVTNGYINEEPFRELAPYIDAMNIDVKCYDDHRYWDICKARLEPVLRTVEIALEEKIHVELTCLIVTGFNDEIEKYQPFFEKLYERVGDVYIHLSRYFPRFKYNEEATDITLMLEIQQIAKQYFSQVSLGNVR